MLHFTQEPFFKPGETNKEAKKYYEKVLDMRDFRDSHKNVNSYIETMK